MDRILSKLLLLLGFIINITAYEDFTMPVIALLVSVILSSLIEASGKKKLSFFLLLLWLVPCFINPVFCFSLPLFFYDLLLNNKAWLSVGIPAALLVNLHSFSDTQLYVIIYRCFTALLIFSIQHRLKKAEKALIETRDSSEEITMLLQDKNRRLLQKQDDEINIATIKERNRIAREIHDNVGHMLTRSILQVGALSVINKDETVGEGLSGLKETLNSAMTSIRNSVHDLHDDSINLKATIDEALKEISEKYKVDKTYDFSETMPKNVKLCFIGIAKECISNVVKHSKGDSVNLIIREHPALWHFSFSDNGECDGNIRESGIGISNIRERAAGMSGIANFSSDKKGFSVVVSVPKADKES